MASPANESKSTDLLGAQLRATLDVIPAFTGYANPSGALTFVNQRSADYLGLPPSTLESRIRAMNINKYSFKAV
jgi:PAS domain-containing protein